jgi:hypothetical protein
MKASMVKVIVAAAVSLGATAHAAERLPGEAPGVAQFGMQCEPRSVNASTTLRVRFPTPHGHDFAVASPDGELYFVAFQQPDRSSAVQPLIPERSFAAMSGLTVQVGAFEGIPWRTNGSRRAIFRESGTYTLLVSPALETEDPVIEGWCKITFSR